MKRDHLHRLIFFLAVCFCLTAFGCGDDDPSASSGQGTEVGDDDAMNDDDADADDDSISDDDDDDDDTAPQVLDCSDLGLTARDFVDAQDDDTLYAVAADFTVETLDGSWSFKDHWSGCETYLFIQDSPRQNQQFDTEFWGRSGDVQKLLETLPENGQLFFVSTASDEQERLDALNEIRQIIEDHIDKDDARWDQRIHYLAEKAGDLDGWLGDIMTNPRWGVGIDRFQRVRYIGSYADPKRYDSSVGWFGPNISMAANEAVYYNFEAEREEALDAQDAMVVPLFEGEVISGGNGYAEVILPDLTAKDAYDTMEFDLYLDCDGEGEFGTCPEWDYLVYLYLCDPANPDTCDTEIGRWITTYHREGRWVHDVSGLIPLLGEGGSRRFAFNTSQPYKVWLSLRLSNQGKGARPAESVFLFSGGDFDPDYNDSYAPVDVEIPATAIRVKLATVISGHGGASPGNCAEFCDTTHHFTVEGDEYVRDFPEAGTTYDCMDKTAEGAVPNQYGTWWYGRSGWCPGKEVPVVMIDVTDSVTPGQTATLEYEGFYNGAPYPSGGAMIRLVSWVVFYEETK